MWDFVSHYQKYCSRWISPFKAATLSVLGVIRCRENRVAPVIFLHAPLGIPSVRAMSLFCQQLSAVTCWHQKEDEWCFSLSVQSVSCGCPYLTGYCSTEHTFQLQGYATQACGMRSWSSSTGTSAKKSTLRCLCFRCRGFQISLASL